MPTPTALLHVDCLSHEASRGLHDCLLHTMNGNAGRPTDSASLDSSHGYSRGYAGGDNIGQKALALNIRKYRTNGMVFATVGLASIILATLFLERSTFSILWIFPVLATVAFLQFEYAANIENAFIGEVQRLQNEEEKPSKEKESSLTSPESAEWLNEVIRKLVPIVNTDLLLPVMDLLEDAMASTFPRIFSTVLAAVRIDEVDLGVTPFKLVHMKQLDVEEPIAEHDEPGSDTSRYVTMEATFAYDGLDRHQASDNVHLLMYIAAGVKKWSTVDIPVFAELQSASGTMRVRAELISDPPFVR